MSSAPVGNNNSVNDNSNGYGSSVRDVTYEPPNTGVEGSTSGLDDKQSVVTYSLPIYHIIAGIISSVLLIVSLPLNKWVRWNETNDEGLFFKCPYWSFCKVALWHAGVMILIAAIISVLFHTVSAIILQRVKSGKYSQQWGYGVIGLGMLFTSSLLIVAGGVFSPISQRAFSYVYNVRIGPAYIIYMDAAALSFVNASIIIIRNKLIPHAISLLLSMCWISFFAASLTSANHYNVGLVIGCSITYVLYLVEALRSPTLKYLDRMSSSSADGTHYSLLTSQHPNIDLSGWKKWLVHPSVYIFISACGLSWPYRLYLEALLYPHQSLHDHQSAFEYLRQRHVFCLLVNLFCILFLILSAIGKFDDSTPIIALEIVYSIAVIEAFVWAIVYYRLKSTTQRSCAVHPLTLLIVTSFGIAWPYRRYVAARYPSSPSSTSTTPTDTSAQV